MNKVILITGSSSGFGRESALKFAKAGWIVYAGVKEFDQDVIELKRVVEDEKLSIHICKLDVRKQDEVDAVVAHIKANMGRVDLLLNNAGFGSIGPVEDFTVEEVKEQFEVNLFGVVRLNRAVVPMMRESGSGMIINVSSINGKVSLPLYGVYAASKHALESISEVQRFELEPFGIKVVLVEPGAFNTKFSLNRKLPKQLVDGRSPYNEWATPLLERLSKASKGRMMLMSRSMAPERVADLLFKIANSNRPRLRYMIGASARLLYFARRVLPYPLWIWCLRATFSWRAKVKRLV